MIITVVRQSEIRQYEKRKEGKKNGKSKRRVIGKIGRMCC